MRPIINEEEGGDNNDNYVDNTPIAYNKIGSLMKKMIHSMSFNPSSKHLGEQQTIFYIVLFI